MEDLNGRKISSLSMYKEPPSTRSLYVNDGITIADKYRASKMKQHMQQQQQPTPQKNSYDYHPSSSSSNTNQSYLSAPAASPGFYRNISSQQPHMTQEFYDIDEQLLPLNQQQTNYSPSPSSSSSISSSSAIATTYNKPHQQKHPNQSNEESILTKLNPNSEEVSSALSERIKRNVVSADVQDVDSSIYVSVASYRDSETPKTLHEMFSKAKNPRRIIALVHEQNYPDDVKVTAFPGSQKLIASGNLRVLSTHAQDAMGPMWARAQIEKSLRSPGEGDYWLQIDSHVAFIKNWDTALIQQHAMTPDPFKSLLTTYPPNFNQAHRSKVAQLSLPTFITFSEFTKPYGYPLYQTYQFKNFPKAPRQSLFYGACFVFGPATMIDEVPYDDSFPYLFTGEEFYMAARLYTFGYNMYLPLTSVVYHLTNRDYRNTYWEQFHRGPKCKVPDDVRQDRKQQEQASYRLMDDIMLSCYDDSEEGTRRYSEYVDCGIFGTERSLMDFYNFCGVDIMNKRNLPRAKLGVEPNASAEEWSERFGNKDKTKFNQIIASMVPLAMIENNTKQQQQRR